MQVLVSAASRHGASREIAETIADELRGHGLEVALIPPGEVDGLDGYGAVVLGSAVYAGRWLRAARRLVRRLGPELTTRPVWLFSSGPVGDPPVPEDGPVDRDALLEATGARDHRVFGGRIDKAALSMPERAVVRTLRVAEGDWRDRGEITGWAGRIATDLHVREA